MNLRKSTTIFVCLLLAAAVFSLALRPATTADAHHGNQALLYSFPAADIVFPEGIAYHEGSRDFFVGSTNGGAVYRGNELRGNRQIKPFLPAGSDGRTTAIGMKVNSAGQLFIAGGGTGGIWVYDTDLGELLGSFNTGRTNGFLNDVALAPDGSAYFTDSLVPILFRLAPDGQGGWELEEWLDLNTTPIQYVQGFNLNGIDITPDGMYLIVVQSNTGKLFRIATDTKEVTEIVLAGGDRMTAGDGILLDGQMLYVARNSLNLIVQLRLNASFTGGQQVGSFTNSAFGFTTTITKADNRLLVVNAQFNRRGTNDPVLPFTVASVVIPDIP